MFLLRAVAVHSPLCVSDSLGEHIVFAVEVHDSVLQVELPLVLASVDLGGYEWFGVRGGYSHHGFP